MKIIISPYSRALRNGKNNPKNYPYWSAVIDALISDGHTVIQAGIKGEVLFPNVTSTYFDHNLKELQAEIATCDLFISVDNFFQHFCHLHNKKGIVIFSQSNPKIFGHPENINILKSESFLREKQFDIWEAAPYNLDAYVEPSIIIEAVRNWRA